METQTSFVGTEGGVELDSVSTVDLQLSLIVFPDDAELDDALGDGDDFEGSLVFGVLLEEGGVLESRDKLCEEVRRVVGEGGGVRGEGHTPL